MSLDIQTTLLIAVYTLQVLVMSFIAPRSVQRSLALMIEQYPSTDYPKLYPVPQERMERHFAIYRPLHNAIGVLGFVLLAFGIFYFDNAIQLAKMWALFSVVQIIPAVLRAGWQVEIVRAFRKMPAPSVRSGELRQWHAADFAPTWLLAAGIVGSILALASAGVAYLQPQHNAILILFCGLVSLALLVRMIQLIAGTVTFRRDDPYMSPEDVFNTRRRRVRSLFAAGAFIGVYTAFMLSYASHLVHVDYVYVCIGVSVAYQLITVRLAFMLRQMILTRDFSVYRPTAERTPLPEASHPPTFPTGPSAPR